MRISDWSSDVCSSDLPDGSGNDRVRGALTNTGLRFEAPAVVLTAGTFLAGRIHVGQTQYAGGRMGDPPATTLAAKLRERPFAVDRLKTGTPPRIDGRTLDYSVMTEQPGDDPRPGFSFMGSHADHPRQVSCWITHTSERTHDIIRGALDRSPLYSGQIEGTGTRERQHPSELQSLMRISYAVFCLKKKQ